ncbi:MAG: tellurium resistance protein [Maritimibacter sp.]
MTTPSFKPPIKAKLWARTPPAIFTPIFGSFGLGIAWKRAVDAFGMPLAPSEVILGAVTLLYLFALLAYLSKILRRPAAIMDDLKVLPGRGGLAAMTLSGMLLAAALTPMSEALANTVLTIAVVGHGVLLVLVVITLLRAAPEARSVTPIWHLTFVGFIVSPIAAVPLGWVGFSHLVFWVSLIAAVVIWSISAIQFSKGDVPAPLRPLLAIHLAPAAMLGSVAMLLGYTGAGFGLGIASVVYVVMLLARLKWLLAGGFSPLWGAFTFPLAAFASQIQLLDGAGMGGPFHVIGGIALIAASLIVPYVLWKVVQMWTKGTLAVKTNASQA